MSEKELGSALELAQVLIDHLPSQMKDMEGQLTSLVARARDGDDPLAEMEIIDLLSSMEVTRHLLVRQSSYQAGVQKDITLGDGSSGGSGLAGNSNWIPPTQKWVCPKNECEQWLLVIQEGEDAPQCDQHNIRMVRGNKRKG